MGNCKLFNRYRVLQLGGGLFVLAALLLAVGGIANKAHAEPHPGLNYTMTVPGYAGCDTSMGDAQCYIPPGTNFDVNVTLSPLPADVPSYEGFDIRMIFAGLTSQNIGSVDSWPDCGFPAMDFSEPGVVAMGCAIGIDAPPSTYTGLMGTAGFTCSGNGTITLVHGSGSTDLLQNLQTILSEPGAGETLTITCGSPPTPTVPTTATPQPRIGPTGTGASDGGNETGMLLVVGSLLAIAVLSISTLSWRFARSR